MFVHFLEDYLKVIFVVSLQSCTDIVEFIAQEKKHVNLSPIFFHPLSPKQSLFSVNSQVNLSAIEIIFFFRCLHAVLFSGLSHSFSVFSVLLYTASLASQP